MSLQEYGVLQGEQRLEAAKQIIADVSNWHTGDMGSAGAIILDVLSDNTIPLQERDVFEQNWSAALSSLGME